MNLAPWPGWKEDQAGKNGRKERGSEIRRWLQNRGRRGRRGQHRGEDGTARSAGEAPTDAVWWPPDPPVRELEAAEPPEAAPALLPALGVPVEATYPPPPAADVSALLVASGSFCGLGLACRPSSGRIPRSRDHSSDSLRGFAGAAAARKGTGGWADHGARLRDREGVCKEKRRRMGTNKRIWDGAENGVMCGGDSARDWGPFVQTNHLFRPRGQGDSSGAEARGVHAGWVNGGGGKAAWKSGGRGTCRWFLLRRRRVFFRRRRWRSSEVQELAAVVGRVFRGVGEGVDVAP